MNRKKGLQRREAGYVRKRRKQSGWRVRERERERKESEGFFGVYE